MAKRKQAASASKTQRAPKRQKQKTPAINNLNIGAPNEALDSALPQDTPSSSGLSVRVLPLRSVPTLGSLCIRVFSANLARLYEEEGSRERTRGWLKALPDILASKLLAGLRRECPTILSHAFIVANFMRGDSICLTAEMTGVGKHTVAAISSVGPGLRALELSGLAKIPDLSVANVVSELPELESVVLRGCAKVSTKTATALASHCPRLTVVNLNHTTPSLGSLINLIGALEDLQVLKIAEIPNLGDAAFEKQLTQAFATAAERDVQPLLKLRTLKIRSTSLGDASLSKILAACPGLTSLDVSFTKVRRSQSFHLATNPPPLEKLTLTSTPMPTAEIEKILQCPGMRNLKTLNLAAIGGQQTPILTDAGLSALSEHMQKMDALENVSLAGNIKLGLAAPGRGSLLLFVTLVGHKCKTLNLGGIPRLTSVDLRGLYYAHAELSQAPSPLTLLALSGTSVDDVAASFIGACTSLDALELANTKFTNDGVFKIIDSCPLLTKIDVTSCRGIDVRDRRRIFEVRESLAADRLASESSSSSSAPPRSRRTRRSSL
ncbi:hypothetical protein BOTBODRAFT_27744 [Botryobasidium botryosum FD-172 SS1]|uniref:RNI-like protein n=1 Tax=Botryobasidium botryosum (strain FD-172 SS1) TaxID=930990 RepID=A0A067MX87_BOTB1|nr:hypothetical protein BOTBODRAFT_27744 [Botryobasidium botryosum FD-172 SS1]